MTNAENQQTEIHDDNGAALEIIVAADSNPDLAPAPERSLGDKIMDLSRSALNSLSIADKAVIDAAKKGEFPYFS